MGRQWRRPVLDGRRPTTDDTQAVTTTVEAAACSATSGVLVAAARRHETNPAETKNASAVLVEAEALGVACTTEAELVDPMVAQRRRGLEDIGVVEDLVEIAGEGGLGQRKQEQKCSVFSAERFQQSQLVQMSHTLNSPCSSDGGHLHRCLEHLDHEHVDLRPI